MAKSYVHTIASGSTPVFSVPFEYIDKAHVKVFVDDVLVPVEDYTWPTAGTIQFTAGSPTAGTVITRRRKTPTDPIVTFIPGNLEANDINTADRQSLYLAQEGNDTADELGFSAWVTPGRAAGGTITKGLEDQLAAFDVNGNIVGLTIDDGLTDYLAARNVRISTATRASAGTMSLTNIDEIEVQRYGNGTMLAPQIYRKVAQPANAEPTGNPLRFQDVNGLWFAAIGGNLSLGACGAVADLVKDANAVRITGTDNIDAWERLQVCMAYFGEDAKAQPGQYFFSRQLTHNVSRVVWGAGKDSTYFLVECPTGSETAWCGYPTGDTEGGVDGMTVCICPLVAKTVNNGQYHAVFGMASIYYTSGTLQRIPKFRLTNVRAHRSNNGISSGSAFYGIGYVTGGIVDNLDDIGSPKRHSGGFGLHWAGGGNTGGYGFPVTVTYHPENIRVGYLHFERSNTILGISSSIDITIDNVYTKDWTTLFALLPGDETDRRTVAAQAGRVGTGLHIKNIFAGDALAGNSDAALLWFGIGVSPWEKYPSPDNALALGGPLYMDTVIDQITVRSSVVVAGKGFFEAFIMCGKFKFGVIDVGSSFSQGKLLDIDRHIGMLEIDTLRGKTTTAGLNTIELTRALGVRIKDLDVTVQDISTSTSRVMFVAGFTDTTALTANVSIGNTVLPVTALVERILPGQTLYIGATQTRATSYHPVGATRVNVEPLLAGASSGATVTVAINTDKVDVTMNTEGGYYGAYVSGPAKMTITKGPSRAGFVGLRCISGSAVNVRDAKFTRNGLNGISGGRDISVDVGARLQVWGGELGIDAADTVQYNVGVPTDDTTVNNRAYLNGVRFMGATTGRTTATSSTDLLMVNCLRDDTGAVVTS